MKKEALSKNNNIPGPQALGGMGYVTVQHQYLLWKIECLKTIFFFPTRVYLQVFSGIGGAM